MSVIGTVEIPVEDFALGTALATRPGVRIRLERVVPIGSAVVPYLWVSNAEVGEVEAALRTESDIESVSVVDAVNGDILVRVEWRTGIAGLLPALVENGATILEAVGEGDTWTMQLRFDDHTELSAFYRQCVDRGISLDLENVHNPGHHEGPGLGSSLTDTQYETLVTAVENGYFEVPRRINLTELAIEMDVSDTAVSQRLRRGIASLLEETLLEVGEEPTGDGG